MSVSARPRLLAALLASLLAASCATIASPAGDDDAVRPSAAAGPFRELRDDETTRKDAPTVLDREEAHPSTDPSALDLDGTGALGDVALYVVTQPSGGVAGVYRFVCSGGRDFDPQHPSPATPVLTATEAWEGGAVSGPDVHRVGAEIWMVYAADGGIGLAKSSDGQTFTKLPEPLLTRDVPPTWELGDAPSSPALLVSPSGELSVFYGAGGSIGEATSPDGTHFTRVDRPVLGLGPSGAFDESWVGDPYVTTAMTEEGRAVTRVYYSSKDLSGAYAIGLAARYGDSGPLSRNAAPAFPPKRDPRSPSFLAYPSFDLMYVGQRAGGTSKLLYSVVALAVAPGTVRLGLP